MFEPGCGIALLSFGEDFQKCPFRSRSVHAVFLCKCVERVWRVHVFLELVECVDGYLTVSIDFDVCVAWSDGEYV